MAANLGTRAPRTVRRSSSLLLFCWKELNSSESTPVSDRASLTALVEIAPLRQSEQAEPKRQETDSGGGRENGSRSTKFFVAARRTENPAPEELVSGSTTNRKPLYPALSVPA